MRLNINNLHKLTTVALLGLITLSCTKEERTLELKPSVRDRLKVIDTVYSSFNTLIADIGTFPTLKEFLEQQEWRTTYDRTYSVVSNSDTTFVKERLAGYKWEFYVFNAPQAVYTGNIIQEVKNGDMGVNFSISGQIMKLDGFGEYLMDSPTLYTDSTFSFLLKHTEMVDSISRTQVIKLQSSR